MEALGGVASVIAVLQITQAVAKSLKNYYRAVKSARADISRLFNEVTSLEVILVEIQSLLKSEHSLNASLGGPVKQCHDEMESLSEQLKAGRASSHRFGKAIQSLKWPFREEEIIKIMKSLERNKAILSLGIDVGSLAFNVRQVSILDDLRSDIIKARKEENRLRIMAWLSTADPSKDHNIARSKHEGTTGSWLLKLPQFQKWTVTDNSFLWMYGNAGSGKSILCSTAIEHMQSHCNDKMNSGIAYWYFTYNDEEKQSVSNFLRSFISQICGQKPDTPGELYDCFCTHAYGTHQPGLTDLLKMLSQVIHGFDNVFLIVDALDECPKLDGERSSLLDTLFEITQLLQPSVHLLVTSRREGDIQEGLKDVMENANCLPPINVQGGLVQNDIEVFIQERLKHRAFRRWPDEMKVKAATTLSKQACGMFRLVALQLDTLSQGVSPDQAQTMLDSLPKTLDSFYEKMLLEIDPVHQKHAIAGLQWLSSSARPLYVDEFSEAIVMNPDERPFFNPHKRLWHVSEVLRIFPAGMVTVTERFLAADHYQSYSEHDSTETFSSQSLQDENSTLTDRSLIQFSHFSVKEYIISRRLSQGKASQYFVNEMLAHRALSETCLLYLSEIAEIGKSWLQTRKDYPLLRYCCYFWSYHVEKLEQDTEHFPNPSLSSFLQIDCLGFKMWAMSATPRQPSKIYDRNTCSPTGFINLVRDHGSTQVAPPAFYISWLGLGRTLKLLLTQDLVDLKDSRCWPYGTPLHIASHFGYVSTVQALLEFASGPDINAINRICFVNGRENKTCFAAPLQIAVQNQNAKISKALVDAGADLNLCCPVHKTTPLRAVILKSSLEMASWLINIGASIDDKYALFESIIRRDTSSDGQKFMRLLQDHGAIPDTQDERSATLIIQSLKWDRDKDLDGLFYYLIKTNINLNLVSKLYNETPLQYAAAHAGAEIIKALISHGALIETGNGRYGNALQACCEWEHDEAKAAKVLIQEGANVNAYSCGEGHGNALQAAAFNGNTKTVRVLLDAGANIFAKGYYENAMDAAEAGKSLRPFKSWKDAPSRYDDTLAVLRAALKSK